MKLKYEEKIALGKLKRLEEFALLPDPDGIDVNRLYRQIEAPKSRRMWGDDEARWLQEKINLLLPILFRDLFDNGVSIKIEGLNNMTIIRPGIKLRCGKTGSLDNKFKLIARKGKIRRQCGVLYPMIFYNIIMIASKLQANPIKKCRRKDCDRFMVTMKERKIYCSPRCRNIQNQRNFRKVKKIVRGPA